MIPYPYNMVDMGGIDLAEANGTVVEGLYAKIVEAVSACGDVVLYNWKFAGIEIAPQHTSILLGNPIIINGAVQVTEQDLVTVPGINPEPPVLVPLSVIENGQYNPVDYDADGFSAVSVEVTSDPPVLVTLNAVENGDYSPADYNADGFSEVSVEVPILPTGKYQEVEPGFFGFATAYLSLIPDFRTDSNKYQCLFIANIETANYVVFLPEIVSTRFRAAKWPGKTVEDFLPYLDVEGAASGQIIFEGASPITGSTELTGDGLTRRFFFTGVNGSVVIGTSNTGQLVKPILLKIQEE